MKLCAVVWCLALPVWCLAQSNPAVQTQREFDLQIVAEGRWHPAWVDWDASGQMWLATASQEDGPSRRGNILVFDKAGRSGPRRFYTGPVINAFVFHRDGIVAGTGSGAVWLRDADGDGVAETKQPLFSSGPLGNLRGALDGWIYASAGERYQRLSRLVRFKPNETSFQTLATIQSDAVAFDLSWERELFFSRPEGPHLSHVGLFQRYFGSGGISNAAPDRKVEDHAYAWGTPLRSSGISTLASIGGNAATPQSFAPAVPNIPFQRISGLCIYEGGAWPERFHGNSYVCDPELRVVHEDVISRPESAYYEGTQRTAGEFISSADASFHPTAVRYGPDGALYVLGSQQPPEMLTAQGRSAGLLSAMPYGRVWRVQHKHPRILKMVDLSPASPAELVTALEHPNGCVRETALRLLVEERGATVAPLLTNLLESSRHAPARVAALWGLHRLRALTTPMWTNAISDIHSAVQKTAWLAFAVSSEPLTRDVEKIVEKQFKDAEERVRIAMLMAVSKGPLTAEGRKAVTKLFPDVKDVWSKSALLTIARETPLEVLKIAFASDKSESFRELAVPLAEQLSAQPGGFEKVKEVVAKSDPEKTEKLTAAVKEALLKPRGK